MAWVAKTETGCWKGRYRAPDGRTRSKTWDRKTDAQKWLRPSWAAATATNGSIRRCPKRRLRIGCRVGRRPGKPCDVHTGNAGLTPREPRRTLVWKLAARGGHAHRHASVHHRPASQGSVSLHSDVVLTAAYTGARFGELAALRIDRLDLLRRRLTVAYTSPMFEVNGR